MKKSLPLLILAVIVMASTLAIGQPGNPSTPAPFGFVEILFGAGLVYGGKKAWDRRKSRA